MSALGIKRLSTLGLLLGITNATAADAAIITWDVLLTIDESDAVEIHVGDKFIISLTFDDTATDNNAATFGGRFPDALQSFSISRDPENTGSWDPELGTPDLDQDNFVTNANGDNMTVEVGGTGFPPASPGDFSGFDLHFAFSVDIVDTGSGQTLAQQFGGALSFDNIVVGGGGILFGKDVIGATGPLGLDSDDDGVPDALDACNSTPPGAKIVADPQDPLYGTLRHDSDGDCDCDLDDFAILQEEFTGPNP